MSWASRRRTTYILSIVIILAVLAGIPLVFFLYQKPTCSDGVQNGSETGVDKGGPCQVLDERTLSAQALLFARGFPVRAGEYGVTAYIQNPNRNAGVLEAKYRFSVYDEKNILIAEREGTTSIMPGAITPVYESGILSGNRTVSRTFFEFTEPLVWVRSEPVTDVLVFANTKAASLESEPSVSSEITNTSVHTLANVRYVATLFDAAGNAFASSETVIPSIAGGATRTIVFTWPTPFTVQPARIDVLPVIELE